MGSFVLIEVTDASVDFDRSAKPGRYVRAGIREFWGRIDDERTLVRGEQRDGRY